MQSIKEIRPGTLNHVVTTESGTRRFPIIINATGLGAPRPISDPTRMIGPERHVRASRWQNPGLSEKDAHGKRFVFIGLGNSTAEMITKLNQFINRGVDVDYRVLTHYPKTAVEYPRATIRRNCRSYRVFRDLSIPDLTSYQGDIRSSEDAYHAARGSGRLVADVDWWDVEETDDNRVLVCKDIRYAFDELYVLIGYQHSREALKQMGIDVDQGGYPRYQYDGEFYKRPVGKEPQIYKGYFGVGAILDAPGNRNSVVLPGMAFRMPDTIFGIYMRAMEYALN